MQLKSSGRKVPAFNLSTINFKIGYYEIKILSGLRKYLLDGSFFFFFLFRVAFFVIAESSLIRILKAMMH